MSGAASAEAAYIREVFGVEDPALASLMPAALAAGLPDIAVSAEVGRLLQMLCALSGGRRALELGTLAGYSAAWIARGLQPGGELLTVEADPAHARFARGQLDRLGLSDRVRVIEATALDALAAVGGQFGPDSFDFIFLDAAKVEYPAYFQHARRLLRPGGVLAADNALSSGWHITDAAGLHPDRDAMDRFNRLVASDPSMVATCVPLRAGVLVAMRIT